jgi:carbamoyl-phosphate synthase large subunit
MVVIEMNPRVSRLLGAGVQGHRLPIAKVAARLASATRLDELDERHHRGDARSFEPSIDYVVTKIPRFAFEKYPGRSPT